MNETKTCSRCLAEITIYREINNKIVCPNCHTMIEVGQLTDGIRGLEELKKLLDK